ncbi:class I SAM-dependent methyltransferase [Pseudomonadota bacterium]
MLRPDVEQTIGLASASLARSRGDDRSIDERCSELHLESLGISEQEKASLVDLYLSGKQYIDPVVSYLVGATGGHLYKDQIGQLSSYPIPELRVELRSAEKNHFLDIGCSWGRWSIAAARKGFSVVGIDPSLGAVLAARRVANQLGLEVRFICGDARYLPFRKNIFDQVFSYSVLQHLAKADVRNCLLQIRCVLKPRSESLIQMPNKFGLRCLQHQIRRRFRQARDFEVRYWTPTELLAEFNRCIGKSDISVDCYFGLGLQAADMDLMNKPKKILIKVSEFLRLHGENLPWLKTFADSVYVQSTISDEA